MTGPPHAPPAAETDAPLSTLVGAFAVVYLVWGSTYLAIRFAVETMPPLLMAGVRFLVAGALLYGWARTRGAPRPTAAQWKAATVAGGLLLLGGNGAVVVAEQWIPSGLAALLVAAVPLWLVLLDAGWGSGRRPTPRVTAGLATGFAGVVLLAGSPGVGAGGAEEFLGAGLVVLGALSWAAGSLYTRYAQTPPRPRLWVGMQMLCGGALLTVAGFATGEGARLDLAAISVRSWFALAYLILFGAILAYSAYIWLLSHVTPARAGTYAYVNPVVALLLGWGLAGEPLTSRSLLAAVVILGSVVVITTERARPLPEALPVE